MDALYMLHPETQERVKVDLQLHTNLRAGALSEPGFTVCQISVWRKKNWEPCLKEERAVLEAQLPEEVRLALSTRRWSDLPFYQLYPQTPKRSFSRKKC